MIPRNTILLGDTLRTLRTLPSESVNCVITSPPYWNLRDYGVPGQYGLEATLDEYLHTMVAVFEEVRRVLCTDGTLWLNMGDSYASNWPCNRRSVIGSGSLPNGKREARPPRLPGGLKDKDLMGMPWRVAFALQGDGWYLRSDIVWHKPNPMPESVRDRPTRAHEYLFLMARSKRYYYDADTIREPAKPRSRLPFPDGPAIGKEPHNVVEHSKRARVADKQRGHGRRHDGFNDRWDQMTKEEQQATGSNKRSVWEVATHPFPEEHFATFPEALIEPCIMAGSRPGDLVLDPFMGSGTVGVVCRRLGRDYLGIEVNRAYVEMAEARIAKVLQPMLLYSPRAAPVREEPAS